MEEDRQEYQGRNWVNKLVSRNKRETLEKNCAELEIRYTGVKKQIALPLAVLLWCKTSLTLSLASKFTFLLRTGARGQFSQQARYFQLMIVGYDNRVITYVEVCFNLLISQMECFRKKNVKNISLQHQIPYKFLHLSIQLSSVTIKVDLGI